MNVKNKIIALVMSFVICFGAVSNSFANDKEYLNSNMYSRSFVGLSPQIICVLGSLGVASGITFSNNDSIVDFAFGFYYKYKENWDTIDDIFKTAVTIGSNQVVSVGKEFLNYFTDFLDFYSKVDINPNINIGNTVTLGTVADLNLSVGDTFRINTGVMGYYSDKPEYFGNVYFTVKKVDSSYYDIYYGIGNSVGNYFSRGKTGILNDSDVVSYKVHSSTFKPYVSVGSINSYLNNSIVVTGNSVGVGSVSIDKVNDNLNDDGSVGIYVPGNVGSLVGSLPGSTVVDGVNSPNYDLPIGGSVSLPSVNDSFVIGADTPFVDTVVDVPSDVPSDSIWATITDFVVSLVVPSDTFWTDLFTGFRDNLNKNFPMLDMSGFDSLLVDGKPFPNMFAFGGKIVDGDTINSIVDWLRPIIAGFVMLLLLFFNYRKLYKIIRNSDPYGSVAEKGCTSNVN